MNNIRAQLLKAGLISQEEYDAAERGEKVKMKLSARKKDQVAKVIEEATGTKEIREQCEQIGVPEEVITAAIEIWKLKPCASSKPR